MSFETLIPAAFFLVLGFGLPDEHDKAKHFSMGAAGATLVEGATDNKLMGCGAALGLGILKEIYDRHSGGDVEALDAVATGLGCSVTLRF